MRLCLQLAETRQTVQEQLISYVSLITQAAVMEFSSAKNNNLFLSVRKKATQIFKGQLSPRSIFFSQIWK